MCSHSRLKPRVSDKHFYFILVWMFLIYFLSLYLPEHPALSHGVICFILFRIGLPQACPLSQQLGILSFSISPPNNLLPTVLANNAPLCSLRCLTANDLARTSWPTSKPDCRLWPATQLLGWSGSRPPWVPVTLQVKGRLFLINQEDAPLVTCDTTGQRLFQSPYCQGDQKYISLWPAMLILQGYRSIWTSTLGIGNDTDTGIGMSASLLITYTFKVTPALLVGNLEDQRAEMEWTN